MQLSTRLTLLLTMASVVAASPANAALSINGYTSVIIPDASSDPYRIGIALRREAQAAGFKVHLSASEVPERDRSTTCAAAWTWGTTAFGGQVHMRLFDLLSGTMIAEVTTHKTNWVGVKATVNKGARQLWSKVGYRGFAEDAHRANIDELFPPRPTLNFDVEAFRATNPSSVIEGIWTDPDNNYEVAITRAPEESDYEFVGVVLESNNPVWKTGEIKLELKPTAVSTAFVGNYYPASKKRQGTTFVLEKGAMLNFQFSAPDGSSVEALFVKTWPAMSPSGDANSAEAGTVSLGSGVVVTIDGLVATNWHVVEGARRIDVMFPRSSETFRATVAIRDTMNDLAILELPDYDPQRSGCEFLPYKLSGTASVELGADVSTIGYPLQDVLGMSPKYTSGVVSSKTGLDDDPRCFQVSAEIQPGSSGSPLFDGNGNLIGIVVSSLNAEYLYTKARALPQNVNYAIKSDYLLNLVLMLPGVELPLSDGARGFTAETASHCVVAVRISK